MRRGVSQRFDTSKNCGGVRAHFQDEQEKCADALEEVAQARRAEVEMEARFDAERTVARDAIDRTILENGSIQAGVAKVQEAC